MCPSTSSCGRRRQRPQPSAKSVVTAAAQAGRPACYLQAADVGATLPEAPGLLLAVDDVEALGPDAQIALFRAFNAARGQKMTSSPAARWLAAAGAARRSAHPHRPEPDLRGQGPHRRRPQRHPQAQAATRGLRLEPEMVQYLLRHGRRDLTSLLRTLDALDAASLERKRAVTLPPAAGSPAARPDP